MEATMQKVLDEMA
jgi:hypothetical protein